ncbi:rod shape-determining protein MreD [Mesonia sp.]|uniref:rod shape-determining protein MreD n=1 Tax=Mesonia sp. TaxID=1960830 RepID=UPI00176A75A7|nr:rod shape-determining protein MreD [Mesonia sp.]HIB38599.1 rod shape-determining protein MreD [Mesonia sp.]HIO28090.1 rod shape-determining protein MreD [Flavobacteriaceae bacterium]
MNKLISPNIIRFCVLVLLQVLILSNINFLGFINPYLYVLFILLLPFTLNQWKVLLYAFLIGIIIDVFQDSGGINAAASLVAAFFRPYILKFAFGVSYEFQTIKFYQTPIAQRFTYITLIVFTHHLVLFSLTYFNFSYIVEIFKSTLFSGVFTIILCLIVMVLFRKRYR